MEVPSADLARRASLPPSPEQVEFLGHERDLQRDLENEQQPVPQEEEMMEWRQVLHHEESVNAIPRAHVAVPRRREVVTTREIVL